MRDRAASRPAPARVPLRVLVAVFTLGVCALACARTTPAAPAPMRTAMTTQVSAAVTEPSMTVTAANSITTSDSGTRPGPSTHVQSASSATNDRSCCASANCRHITVDPGPAQSAAAATHPHPHAPPTCDTRPSPGTSGAEPVPRTLSLTELSPLRI